MSQMNLHFAVRFLIIGIALILRGGPDVLALARSLTSALGRPTGRVSHDIRAVHAPDDQPIVINTERIITAAPAPPDKALASRSPTAAIKT